MSVLSSKLRAWADAAGNKGLTYYCQGCDEPHQIRTAGNSPWAWDGNIEQPTFSPSVLVVYPANPGAAEEFKEWRTERRCHSFVRAGMVEFLGDCTHSLAGQKLPLPDLPEWMR